MLVSRLKAQLWNTRSERNRDAASVSEVREDSRGHSPGSRRFAELKRSPTGTVLTASLAVWERAFVGNLWKPNCTLVFMRLANGSRCHTENGVDSFRLCYQGRDWIWTVERRISEFLLAAEACPVLAHGPALHCQTPTCCFFCCCLKCGQLIYSSAFFFRLKMRLLAAHWW